MFEIFFFFLLIVFQNLLFKKNYFVCEQNKVLSPLPGYLNTKKNRLMYYIKGVLHGRIFMKINKINTHMLYWHYSFVYAEREFSKTKTLNLSFLFIFLLRWINSNKFELIHLHKNIKSTLTLSINVQLKVTKIFCILNSNGID